MQLSLLAIIVLITVSAQTTHRPIKIIAYPYLPDLNGDRLAGLATYLTNKFNADTGRQIQILFDNIHYTTDTYTPSNVVTALTTGGYDMQEIDTIILGNLNENNVLLPIPAGISYDGYSPQVVSMVSDLQGTKWAHPSYTCTNLYFSYDSSISSATDGASFLSWLGTHTGSNQIGWTGDLSSEPDLRLEYLAGWRNSHTDPFYPTGYSPMTSNIDGSVVHNINALRDSCTDNMNTNRCVSGYYYRHADFWYDSFVLGKNVVLQGFPEYTSEVLKRANGDPNNPTRLHSTTTALIGNGGNTPFIFTDAWVISKANCDADCQSTAAIFLAWQQTNWATAGSLGLDLSPQTPRFLQVAYQPFYTSPNPQGISSLASWAQNYYNFGNGEINRGIGLDTVHFWDNEASQSATLESLITVGYHP